MGGTVLAMARRTPTSPPRATAQPKSARKAPRQERSKQMRKDLLAGATRVLEKDGAAAFTTNRVAERAGVSVGSVYQYYPDKAALLADLHEADAAQTFEALAALLFDTTLPARERFVRVVVGAFAAQAAATEHHTALAAADVAPLETEGMASFERRVTETLAEFLRSAVRDNGGADPVGGAPAEERGRGSAASANETAPAHDAAADQTMPRDEAWRRAAFIVEVLFALLDRMAKQPLPDWRRTAEATAEMLAGQAGLG